MDTDKGGGDDAQQQEQTPRALSWGDQAALHVKMREKLLLPRAAATAVFELAMLEQMQRGQAERGEGADSEEAEAALATSQEESSARNLRHAGLPLLNAQPRETKSTGARAPVLPSKATPAMETCTVAVRECCDSIVVALQTVECGAGA